MITLLYMAKILLTLLTILSVNQVFAGADLTDILFNRTATFEERQSVSEVLAQAGQQQPLNVTDAIAEVCYGVDICAGSELQLPSYCDDNWDSEDIPTIRDACYPKYFRQTYSCNTELEKDSYKTVYLAGKLLFDLNTMYRSYVLDYMIDGLSRQYNVDFREMAQNPAALAEFYIKNPYAELRIKTISQELIALAAYTLDCYDSLNTLLYTQNQIKIKRYYNLYKAVINTMNLFPEYKGKVNRGTSLPVEILREHHKVGNIVCYNGFTSTAIHNPKTDMTDKPSNGFLSGKCTQRLYISYDERALGGRNISNGSTSKGEDEILFEPGACFRIDNVFPRTDPPLEDEADTVCEEGQHYNFEMTLIK
jgi:hypothetical protein